ncbi:MAG TPA: DEAD/DEAH box helicase [Candidatus Dormibacteraeota bacterium]|nr:DEAD/DEAH box helicase [Candidatus Dormibacteraeota bacterium]
MGDSLAVRRAEESPLRKADFTTVMQAGRARAALEALAARDRDGQVLTAVRHFPAREAQWSEFPEWVNGDLRAAYAAKGIARLYSHQAEAAETVYAKKNLVIVTPTASGKTLCYNLPVLNSVLESPDTRALYLFPTKALAQDQLAELHDLNTRLDSRFGVFTYDGDTANDARKAIREKGHIVLTNPDMLHTGILPHHTKWTRLFENLKYIVMDELHTYRGVFGSHLCNVLRRLRRIAKFYGSTPQFICCSATIANPGELASRLIEDKVDVLSANGAPAGEKTFAFYNPPVVNKALGIRRSYINESARVAQEFLKHEMQTMVFSNSRLQTEVLLTYLQKANPQPPGKPETIRGYRGGYLPNERREIERGIRDGRIRGVVSTSALELGIDIGSLDSVVMAGYPGTIAATWQRAGRAGRRSGSSCAVMVASSSPLDQFIARHPDYFFGNTPEHAFIQPDNLEILLNHLKCAAFELPIEANERIGEVEMPEILAKLAEAGYLHRAGEFYHWTQEAYPANAVSLRSVTSDNFVIVDITGEPRVIGEVDFPSALSTLHEKAIYLHNGQQYHVEHLDFKEHKAYVKEVDSDYYTDAVKHTQVRILENAEEEKIRRSSAADGIIHARAHGDVLVRSQVVAFKKIKFFTNENIGDGKLELPENEMHTTSYWMTLERGLVESLPFSVSERQSGMFGLLHAMASVAALLLMCDGRDLGIAVGERPPKAGSGESEFAPVRFEEMPSGKMKEFFEPNLYLYDAYPGGIGFSEPLFRAHEVLMEKTRELIVGCECEEGCPSCVGPAGDLVPRAKEAALAILERVCG